MNTTLLTINEEITTYIGRIDNKNQHDYSKIAELATQYISQRLEYAKQQFENKQDIDPDEEIFYFKYIKSHLLALIQYYTLIQRIELRKPPVKKKQLKKYYLKELYKAKRKLRKQHFFYNYYKANSNYLDGRLFLRFNKNLFLTTGEHILDIDKQNDTPAVHIFAQVEAYEMLRHYLKKKIKTSTAKTQTTPPKKESTLKWTASKVDMIELIYALHASGVFNNGRADIKEIAECFQDMLDVDLGQYNRVFYDIRSRKINKTKFLDTLKDNLKKRMNETENQLFI